jgi:hypothetical protein
MTPNVWMVLPAENKVPLLPGEGSVRENVLRRAKRGRVWGGGDGDFLSAVQCSLGAQIRQRDAQIERASILLPGAIVVFDDSVFTNDPHLQRAGCEIGSNLLLDLVV